jgi:hypothetical protein
MIQYKPFIDYKSDNASDKLPLSSDAYWHTLEDVLTKYVMHNDNKFDYDNQGIAHRKHIIVDRIRFIGKESNNLDEASVIGVKKDDYTEYTKDHEIVNSEDFKQKVKKGTGLKNKSKIARILFEYYKSKSTAQ